VSSLPLLPQVCAQIHVCPAPSLASYQAAASQANMLSSMLTAKYQAVELLSSQVTTS